MRYEVLTAVSIQRLTKLPYMDINGANLDEHVAAPYPTKKSLVNRQPGRPTGVSRNLKHVVIRELTAV